MALTKVDGSLLSGSISAATLPTSQLSGTVTSSQIASITSSQVTTALGYTPYNASNPSGYGTVTSVATGNGLQGGTITTSGTLSIACPSALSVGAYSFVGDYYWYDGVNGAALGANVSGKREAVFIATWIACNKAADASTNGGYGILPGTWKIMQTCAGSNGAGGSSYFGVSLVCRVA